MVWRLCLAMLALVFAAPGGDSRAAQESPVPLEELQPVLYVVGPASAPVCGGVGLVAFLGPAALGPNAAAVFRAASPVFTLCGAIEPTPVEDRYACDLDAQALELIGAVTGLAGVPPAVDLRPVGQLLEQAGRLGEVLFDKERADELLAQPSVVLQCTQGLPVAPEPTIPPDIQEPVVDPPAEDAPVPSFSAIGDAFVPAPTFARPVPSITTVDRPAALNTPLGRVPFSYAAVFVLPFVVLLTMGLIGSSLLRPLDLDPTSNPNPRRLP